MRSLAQPARPMPWSRSWAVLLLLAVSTFSATHPAPAAKCVPPGPDSAIIIVPDDVSIQVPRADSSFSPDSVAALTPDGVCVGAAMWKKDAFAISVARRNRHTARGIKPGHTLRFEVYDVSYQSARTARVSYLPCRSFKPGIRPLCQPDGRFQPNAVFIVQSVNVTSRRYRTEQGPSVPKTASLPKQEPNLIDVQARRKLDTVELRWTADEMFRETRFQIQRWVVQDTTAQASVQPSWATIGVVAAAAQAGQSYRYEDKIPFRAERVVYRIRHNDRGVTWRHSKEMVVNRRPANRLSLHPPFPNPARSRVTLRYELPTDSDVRLDVYDMLGRRVITATRGAEDVGRSAIHLDVSGLASGTYVCRLSAGKKVRTQTMRIVH